MKAFFLSVLAMAAISVGAWALLGELGFSSADQYQKPDSVRLD
ncbi:MAG: hypothetical protein AAFV49_10250 [Pseudomonadota bacterium]